MFASLRVTSLFTSIGPCSTPPRAPPCGPWTGRRSWSQTTAPSLPCHIPVSAPKILHNRITSVAAAFGMLGGNLGSCSHAPRAHRVNFALLVPCAVRARTGFRRRQRQPHLATAWSLGGWMYTPARVSDVSASPNRLPHGAWVAGWAPGAGSDVQPNPAPAAAWGSQGVGWGTPGSVPPYVSPTRIRDCTEPAQSGLSSWTPASACGIPST